MVGDGRCCKLFVIGDRHVWIYASRVNWRTCTYFTYLLLSSFFRQLLSALAEWNCTKTGHMLGSECNLKMHVNTTGNWFVKTGYLPVIGLHDVTCHVADRWLKT